MEDIYRDFPKLQHTCRRFCPTICKECTALRSPIHGNHCNGALPLSPYFSHNAILLPLLRKEACDSSISPTNYYAAYFCALPLYTVISRHLHLPVTSTVPVGKESFKLEIPVMTKLKVQSQRTNMKAALRESVYPLTNACPYLSFNPLIYFHRGVRPCTLVA